MTHTHPHHHPPSVVLRCTGAALLRPSPHAHCVLSRIWVPHPQLLEGADLDLKSPKPLRIATHRSHALRLFLSTFDFQLSTVNLLLSHGPPLHRRHLPPHP